MWKQRKICRAHSGKKHKLESKRLRFALETTDKPERWGFDIMGADRVQQMIDAITLFDLVFEKEMETLLNERS